jgi:CheY-like chemotaxis protein
VNCGKRVLVVEDDKDVRESVMEALEVGDYRPVGAATGVEALERLRGGAAPCVILLDMMMPVMDGWEFRAVQRGDPQLAEIPVVVLSAHAGPHAGGAPVDAAEYLRKPVRLETLLSTIERYCVEPS